MRTQTLDQGIAEQRLAFTSPERASRHYFLAHRVANETLTGWIDEGVVVVNDGRIEDVVRRSNLPDDLSASARVIRDLGDVYLLPGLIETHVHMHFPAGPDYRSIAEPEAVERLIVKATVNMRRLLISGATTVRDTGSRDDVAFAIRSALRDGIAPGPRLVVSGAPITTTAGHYWFLGNEADTVDQVVRSVRERKKLGADFVKIIASGGGYTPTSNPRSQQYELETLRAATDEAHRLGMPVAAHSLTGRSNRICAEAGVDTIIHGGLWLSEYPNRDYALAYDAETTDIIAERGIWIDPTIGELQLHEEWHAAGNPTKPEFDHWALPDVPAELGQRVSNMRDMLLRGARLIGGMGMGMPIVAFDSVACSAQVYEHLLGMDPWAAIRTITADAASACGVAHEAGAIKSGHVADLVGVDVDPITDLSALRRPRHVIQSGHTVVADWQPLI